MNRLGTLKAIRQTLINGQVSIGSWMQIPDPSVAEIMGDAGYDWVAIDLEHGSISIHQLPNLCRALELGGTLPLVRLAQGQAKDCKQALDSGAGGVIVPMIQAAVQLEEIRDACRWPPAGNRGVGFSRANLFGKYFDSYASEAQEPLLVAMVEDIRATENLEEILQVEGLDAILIGPYDLSASLGVAACFDSEKYLDVLEHIRELCIKHGIAIGVHIVDPNNMLLQKRITEGYTFIAFSIDAVFLHHAVTLPIGLS